MNFKTNPITRRTALRGLGAAIALPYLEIMGRTALAAGGKSGQKEPPRLACFYVPGGIDQYRWFPADTGFDYKLAESHEPLATCAISSRC